MPSFCRLLTAVAATGLFVCPSHAAVREPTKVYAIVTVIVKAGKDADYIGLLRSDITAQAKNGLRLVSAYAIQFGIGNRHIQVWEADSAEIIRRAAFESNGYSANLLDIIEREDIEIAVQDK